MKRLKRLNAFTNAHPGISMFLGWIALYLVLFAFVLAFLPDDPPMERATYSRGAT